MRKGATMLRSEFLVVVLFIPVLFSDLVAQSKPDAPEFEVKEYYTKYEYRVSMRDGVHLFTSVYVPKDSSRSYPFLINRTPYSVAPYGVDLYRKQLGPSPDFDKAGYIFVFQDVRGRYMSEWTFVEMRPHIDNKKSKQDVDDSSDLYDTIEWLLKNVPNNNGNAGIWGISYPGFFTSASIIDSHPALKAASPEAPMTDLFMGDDAYHGGAFMLNANFGFYVSFKPQENPQLPPKTPVPFDYGTKDGYEFYLGVGPIGNLSKYLEGKSALFDDQMHTETYDYYRKNILFPFFEQYLKGNGDAKLPKAYVFETGTDVWRQYSAWPPKEAEAKTLYFRAGGGLSFEPPASESSAFDEYVSDPAKPVPFVNYVSTNVPQEYMLSDQRFASSRTDVLVYETPALQEDVTIAGPISPRLFVSTSGTDSDWDVKLIDVYPADYPDSKFDAPRPEDKDKPRTDVGPPSFTMGGYQQLVRGEPFRGKFRHSFEKPEPFTPGKVDEIYFTMQDVNHTFRRGHRIMVQIQSSWFPLTDRNPQTFVNIPDAKPADFVKASERVYHAKGEASGIVVGVMPSPGEEQK